MTWLYRLIEWFLRRKGRCIFPFADGYLEFMKPPRRYLIDLSRPCGNKIISSTDTELGGRPIGPFQSEVPNVKFRSHKQWSTVEEMPREVPREGDMYRHKPTGAMGIVTSSWISGFVLSFQDLTAQKYQCQWDEMERLDPIPEGQR